MSEDAVKAAKAVEAVKAVIEFKRRLAELERKLGEVSKSES